MAENRTTDVGESNSVQRVPLGEETAVRPLDDGQFFTCYRRNSFELEDLDRAGSCASDFAFFQSVRGQFFGHPEVICVVPNQWD